MKSAKYYTKPLLFLIAFAFILTDILNPFATIVSAEESDDDANNSKLEYPLEGEDNTLSFWHQLYVPAYEASLDDNPIWQKVQENTGVTINWISPAAGSEEEQLGMLIASQDLPDIIAIDEYYMSAGGSVSGVNDGIFIDLTDKLAENSPDYLEAITADPFTWKMCSTADNRITEYNQIKSTAPAWQRTICRPDMMEKVGWGDRRPVTMDDYTELFGDFKEKLGIPSIAIGSKGRSNQLMFPYGIMIGFFVKEDGSIGYGMYEDGYRDYLAQMAEWYEKGYIHPDFTGDIEPRVLLGNEELAIVITAGDVMYAEAKLSGYDIEMLNYPRLEEGQTIPFEITFEEEIPADSRAYVITTDCDNVDLAMQFMNYGYTQEGADLFNWGIEGVSYTVNEDGEKEFTDILLDNPDGIPISDAMYIWKIHLAPKHAEPDIVCNPATIGDPVSLAQRLQFSDDPTVNSDGILVASLSPEQESARAQIMTDVNTYVDIMTMQFILGETDINDDDEWATYKQTLEDLQILEAIEITQEAQDAFESKEIPEEFR